MFNRRLCDWKLATSYKTKFLIWTIKWNPAQYILLWKTTNTCTKHLTRRLRFYWITKPYCNKFMPNMSMSFTCKIVFILGSPLRAVNTLVYQGDKHKYRFTNWYGDKAIVNSIALHCKFVTISRTRAPRKRFNVSQYDLGNCLPSHKGKEC